MTRTEASLSPPGAGRLQAGTGRTVGVPTIAVKVYLAWYAASGYEDLATEPAEPS